ncbi:hypothetical protein IRM71_02790 [Erwinia amylovora]|uniref:DUF5710 domain-containing protein n=1 Tax=Erwinia amylovora TaxID=552 RepID=UPI0014443F1F|nr:DUF5710 domain-containing protein [Erwinia amylovora]UDJ86344.1 hypothetical protein IRM68_15100 [Erwinia amylovora]UDJ97804.1 hypothetical protein IRM69_11030 [Erwinia amylovora]UDK90136.1 hypothetical protein IRM70_02790 [Erwinia amylovora]UDK93528.1 hypothetical protein IRM71_02790 [Erwinia amylovora]UOD74363.1 hypothetical protein IRM67_15490 [Erwinia amylovora]
MSHLILNVPFNEKDEVKSKGARWNPDLKKWYVPEGKSSLQFIPWIEELKDNDTYQLYSEYYFIGENKRLCWKCEELISLYAFCLPRGHKCRNVDYLDPDDEAVTEAPGEWQYYDGLLSRCDSDGTYFSWSENPCFSGVSNITDVNPRALSQIRHFSPSWRPGFSKAAGASYYANHCSHCARLQGDFMIFSEPGGAFLPDSSQQAAKIKLYKIDEPVFLNGGTCFTTCDFYEDMTHMP